MRLWLLYLRSRRVFPAAVGIALVASLCWVGGNRWGDRSDLFLIISVTAPLAAAAVVCATATSPFGELEPGLGRPLTCLRIGHLAGLLIVATTALVGASTAWQGADVEWRLARNLLGLTGLGLLCVPILGGRLSWVTPLGFAMLAIVQSGTTGGAAPRWAWVMHPPARGAATAIAILLLLGGLALAARVDARDVYQAGAS